MQFGELAKKIGNRSRPVIQKKQGIGLEKVPGISEVQIPFDDKQHREERDDRRVPFRQNACHLPADGFNNDSQ